MHIQSKTEVFPHDGEDDDGEDDDGVDGDGDEDDERGQLQQ